MKNVFLTGTRSLHIGLATSLCSMALLAPTSRGEAQSSPPVAGGNSSSSSEAKPALPLPLSVATATRTSEVQDARPASQDTAPSKPADNPAQQNPPTPAVPAPTPPGTFSFSGLLDLYYGINFRAPRAAGGGPFASALTPSGESIGIDNVGRAFDINDRELTLSLGELNFTRTEGKGIPFAITGTVTLEYALLRNHLITRLEYRHDQANYAFFGAGSGNTTPDQDTLTASTAYKF